MNLALSRLSGDLQDLAKEWPLVFMFKLPPEATIVVAGCYDGRVMELLANVYPDYGQLVGFDIQKEVCNAAESRFAFYHRVRIYRVGLGTESFISHPARYGSRDTTLLEQDLSVPQCDIREVNQAFKAAGIRGIDLLLLNMEGYEYELIPYLIETEEVDIDRVVAQFHPNMIRDHFQIQDQRVEEAMSGYNKVVNQYPQWVYWCKKGLPCA